MNTVLQTTFNNILLMHNTKDFKYLLAVSGGVDSMVLLDLFRRTNVQFLVAHCNFQLRGEDSIGDEEFVRNLCAKHQIPFHTIRFDVQNYVESGNYSVEMACRNLRYDWFNELMKINHINYLVTAHHLQDNLETFMINLSRGTGLKGLVGMQISTDRIFRPLIESSKKEILDYSKFYDLKWREDYTNQTDIYVRNKIRHHITPVLQEIHPSFESNFQKTLSILNDSESFIQDQINIIRKELIPDETYTLIPIRKLDNLKNKDFIQFYLFEKYGFKSVDLINKLKISENSRVLLSNEYRLIKDRNNLILQRLSSKSINEIDIEHGEVKINSLNLKFIQETSKIENAMEVLDADKISFPLKLRKYQEGDYFYPFGMNGKKKLISKFFKDLKFSKIDKEEAWMLVDSQNRIVWVVNQRIDDRFKVELNCKNFLNIIAC